ncbi:arp2/3 complex-activating protein rickA-like isoform X1 [Triticum urartu]|uniref:arp2/3 complex-activating protein rickA-like isoform X1 n=1 Tax=Triticum urartu TaxID=4572 RepID=UPI002043C7DF|nr:arp2/3 complex-activating protein rickA-like isoform X1 [Triticum urartu]XP_048543859.1 arp2/3 complex-activating protein rickA-like isoform X1 [Triticum urartu]
MGAATDEAEEKADAVGLLHGYSRGGGEGGRRGRSWRMALKMSNEHPLSRPMLPVATTPEPSSPLTSPPSSPSTSPQDNLPPPPPILPEDHQPSPRPTLRK